MAPGKQRKRQFEASDSSPLGSAVLQRDEDIIEMVRGALDRRDVLLAFQPIVRATDHRKAAFYEGLIRVLDDTGRVIPAREFISACETHEIGRIIDCLALEMGLTALHQAPSLRLAINMSARSIGYPRWMQTLERGLAMEPTLAERLIIEITEASAMVMPDITSVFMLDLQTRGVAFALDDFGAGYTAFRYFKDFFFDILKIDGQFVRGVSRDPDNRMLVEAMVAIARHFDMFTVAEFVENAEDAAVLSEIGVDCLQGYHFGAPTTSPGWREFPQGMRRAG
ncbi:EAL domain-containing protein [Oceanicola sp. 502str15]|uniref:EAL domain-containing protein n=1 Tax=Oceanicola sp. 502str15 TaxID=2696061 RepID=UPI002095FB32|nr:EAL domain-containing protein [Oceanicola sp. 502str15]MCO6385040.1 EAL domain-containing protein [Oceanicola sp. 502str15]